MVFIRQVFALLLVASVTQARLPSPFSEEGQRELTPDNDLCNKECYYIDFNKYPGTNRKIPRGKYIKDEFRSVYGFRVRGQGRGGYTPGGAVRIFDTSNPGTAGNGDPDLGSPNQKCGGPGVGRGGEPGASGENCEREGNVLIIQESNKSTPDDNAQGGRISFYFDHPMNINFVVMMDVDKSERMVLWFDDNSNKIVDLDGLGDNSKEDVFVNEGGVKKLDINLSGSGAVSAFEICEPCDAPKPAQTCGKNDFQGECTTTGGCRNKYGSSAYDCKNSEGGVCFCGNNKVCGCN